MTRGALVETVRGPVPADELGPTLAHEHIFLLGQEALVNFPQLLEWNEEAALAAASARLSDLGAVGVRTIIDPTAVGAGRDVGRLKRLSDTSDLNLVVCTGIYAYRELPTFLKFRATAAIVELLVREIAEGIGDTGVKAAFVKCAVESDGVVGDVPRILRVTTAVSRETKAPIMVHTNGAAQTGRLALAELMKADIDPARVVIAHAGDSNDLSYLASLAREGAYLGLDRFNIPYWNPDEQRIDTLISLLEAGYGDRLHLGHDAAVFADFAVRNPDLASGADTFTHIHEKVLPELMRRGVGEEAIRMLLVDNPRRWLTS